MVAEADIGPVKATWVAPPRRVRVEMSGRGLAALVAVGVAVVAVVGMLRFPNRPPPHPVPPLPAVRETTQSEPVPAEPEVVVSVAGQVVRPGVVRLPAGARVVDALALAGGPQAGADLLNLPLARRLVDGDQIVVGGGTGPSSVRSATTSGVRQPAAPPGVVNLNTATLEQLDALPGVGPATAAAIVEWRRVNGRFRNIDQLGSISGIGPAKLAKLRPLVRL